jgi:rubrerythrin
MAPENQNVVQLTSLEALGIAIKGEIETAETYERLANLCGSSEATAPSRRRRIS